MKKTVTYIITIIGSLFAGCALMYGIIYFYPNTIVEKISKEERTVNVVDEGISEGVYNIYDAVVVIESYYKGRLISTGSGFVYKKTDSEGFIMTNHHVIDGSDEIVITFLDSTETTATLKGADEYADIAVLSIDASKVKSVAKIGSKKQTKLGDTVFTIGAPMGKEYMGTVTRGILSGKDRMVSVNVSNSSTSDWIMNVMQTDAAINPGNSGGPLCNASGEVIGVNSLKIVESSIEGIGFAIPIEDAINYADKLASGKKIIRSYLGVEMVELNQTIYLKENGINVDSSIKEGVVISNVISESPADKGGIKKGDVIVSVSENKISSIAELRYYLYKNEPGSKVNISIIRGKDEKKIEVTLKEQ
jgi:serine protease Do